MGSVANSNAPGGVPITVRGTADEAPFDRGERGLSRFPAFLKRHPVLLLLLFTPGIPEYLSGSSPLSDLVLNPAGFVLQLVLNLALYGPGVLVIREARVRWKKGWGTVLLLGASYSILEEGIALSTFFNPHAGPVGSFGSYGHWIGVNWVWVSGLVIFHALWSISLPILLLGLALPETNGRSLLSDRQVVLAATILAADVLVLLVAIGLEEHFWAGPARWAGAGVAMLALAYAAYRCPAGLLRGRLGRPATAPWRCFVVGAAFLWAILVEEAVAQSWNVPAAVAVVGVVALGSGELVWVLSRVGRPANPRPVVALAAGLVAGIGTLGTASQLFSGLGVVPVLAVDALAVLFFVHLLRNYPEGPGTLDAFATAARTPEPRPWVWN